MILQSRRLILSSLGFLVLTFLGQPLWTALHGALAKLPSRTDLLTTASAPVRDIAWKSSSVGSGQSFGEPPIYFEPNVGQTDAQVKFIARGSGVTTFLTATDAVLALPVTLHPHERGNPVALTALPQPDPIGKSVASLGRFIRGFGMAELEASPPSSKFERTQSAIANRQSAISMKLVGANPKAQSEGFDRLPGISNYFIGNYPSKWRTNVPHYAKLRYHEVYPGIDLAYYSLRLNEL